MNSSINASKIIIDNEDNKIISKAQAEEAVKTLLRYIGEDPEREGLLETPKRVIKSFNEFYAGYSQDPERLLSKTSPSTISPFASMIASLFLDSFLLEIS